MMADNTLNYGFPYPQGTDQVVVHSDVEKLAKAVDAQALQTSIRVDSAVPYRGNLDEQSGTLATLPVGRYTIRYPDTPITWGLPQALLGDLLVESSGSQKTITQRPNDAAVGWGTKAEWVLATNSDGTLRDRWQRRDKAIMRTAPVVLTAPAGEYTQVVSRGAHRLPFTVPTDVAKVRVHMRPWNYRTRQEWGPAVLEGAMIAAQAADGTGTVTGTQWEVPGAAGRTVPGAGWTSDWFHVNLAMDGTFLFSYGAAWQDAERSLVMGQCWSHEDASQYTSTADAIFQNGWGGFALQPMDIWIECEAPSTVPVWGYFGASNTMGMSASPSVFGSYPQLHARKNRAFCALTAAGGWSIMDDTLHDQAIVRRFGYPARMLDRLYLDLGSNIAARNATLADAQAELTRWMNTNRNSFGSPDVYLATQIARDDITETSDLAGTLSAWNEWVRYELSARAEVRGVVDFAAIFADPARPWTARQELRASPTDVHFGTVGQRLRARACDGEIQLPMTAARDASEMGATVTYDGDGVYTIT